MASEYGWTLDEIFDCSLEEIGVLLEAVCDRKMREQDMVASLHGVNTQKTRHISDPGMIESLIRQGVINS